MYGTIRLDTEVEFAEQEKIWSAFATLYGLQEHSFDKSRKNVRVLFQHRVHVCNPVTGELTYKPNNNYDPSISKEVLQKEIEHYERAHPWKGWREQSEEWIKTAPKTLSEYSTKASCVPVVPVVLEITQVDISEEQYTAENKIERTRLTHETYTSDVILDLIDRGMKLKTLNTHDSLFVYCVHLRRNHYEKEEVRTRLYHWSEKVTSNSGRPVPVIRTDIDGALDKVYNRPVRSGSHMVPLSDKELKDIEEEVRRHNTVIVSVSSNKQQKAGRTKQRRTDQAVLTFVAQQIRNGNHEMSIDYIRKGLKRTSFGVIQQSLKRLLQSGLLVLVKEGYVSGQAAKGAMYRLGPPLVVALGWQEDASLDSPPLTRHKRRERKARVQKWLMTDPFIDEGSGASLPSTEVKGDR